MLKLMHKFASACVNAAFDCPVVDAFAFDSSAFDLNQTHFNCNVNYSRCWIGDITDMLSSYITCIILIFT